MHPKRTIAKPPGIPPPAPKEPGLDSLLELRRGLTSKDPKEMQDAAWEFKSLAESGGDVSSLISILPQALKASFSPESGTLAKTYLTEGIANLAKTGADLNACLPVLISALDDNSIQVRNSAILALGSYGLSSGNSSTIAPSIFPKLSDIAPIVKGSAMSVLKSMAKEDTKAAERILSLLDQDPPSSTKSYHEELRAACSPDP